ncbi:MAG: DUF2911 domain-containing protein [Chitinophagaceae bacterium]|nr:MAG: DUF2911 domain-containing protein [Chitinophagaceae bacterium]
MILKNYLKQGIAVFTIAGLFSACNSNHKHAPVTDTTIKNKLKDSIGKSALSPIDNAYVSLDVSPMDMAYYPKNYPQLKLSAKLTGEKVENPVMRIIYSRPHLHGRKLYPDIFNYNEPWRLGANEATEIQFFKPVIIDKKSIPAGRYTLYAIPEKDAWTIAINKSVDDWGLKQDSAKDLVRVKVPITYNNKHTEYFTMMFEKAKEGNVNLEIAWDDIIAELPIKVR